MLPDQVLSIEIGVPVEKVWHEITKTARSSARSTTRWRFTMGADDFFTLVTWELAAIPSGCRVKLTHSRWPDTARTYKNVTKTWTEILRLLKIDLETGNIPMGTKLMYGMFSALEFMLPKSTSVEEISRSGW